MSALLHSAASLANGASLALAQAMPDQRIDVPLSQVFTYLFLMLGPIKLLGPFVKITAGADDAYRRKLAVRAFFFAFIAGVVAAVMGQLLVEKWNIRLPALLITAGIVLFLVALRSVLGQYDSEPATKTPFGPPPPPPPMSASLSPLAFPTIITPYGVAVLILLLAATDSSRKMAIFGVLLAVLVLDLAAMIFARKILGALGVTTLWILGAVLGVLQVALAIQLAIYGVRLIGAMPPLQ
jgi:multiple antibiotic resistance protein